MLQVSNAPSDFPGATSDQPKVEAERASDTAEQQDALGMASNPESLPTMRATTTTTKTTIIVPAAELLPVAESAPLVLKKAAAPAAATEAAAARRCTRHTRSNEGQRRPQRTIERWTMRTCRMRRIPR